MKASILALILLCGCTFTSFANYPAYKDSLPPLHTIKEEDIADIHTPYDDDVLTVTLKNGSVYVYQHENWDLEDRDPAISKKLSEAIRHAQKTFTRAEYAPQFPGGQEAWEKYLKAFCKEHKKEIKAEGEAQIIVQFIVHLKGQVTDVGIVANRTNSNLAPLAIQAIKDGPAWVPATQNGRTVVCYMKQLITLSR